MFIQRLIFNSKFELLMCKKSKQTYNQEKTNIYILDDVE